MSGVAPLAAGFTAGLQVLVVEDEVMLAVMIDDMLTDCGCSVTKVSGVGKALQLIASASFDVALLDVNVAGEPVYPVAQDLDRRGIPFGFVTGYSSEGVRADYRDRPILAKPFKIAGLRGLLAILAKRRDGDVRE